MSSLVESIITQFEQSFSSRISEEDSPEEFADEMRTELDQDMCSELFYKNGLCKITLDEWHAALDEIYELALEFAYDYQEPELSPSELEL
ncbi:hypothetical protein [Pseudomonas sp. BN411]|uniref:hypothetical protein n=1 Tax=Pseudomonas sp. BN411 TaxID=2567887 RepID=UPI002457FF78|nr:hypothetical protein [Pseudomonas sp. BN411]MDH4561706.1 hypothetical protein [Pseudomonas sp. BN411]